MAQGGALDENSTVDDVQAFGELVIENTPLVAEGISAYEAGIAAIAAFEAIRDGRKLDALLETGSAVLSAAGAVPIISTAFRKFGRHYT